MLVQAFSLAAAVVFGFAIASFGGDERPQSAYAESGDGVDSKPASGVFLQLGGPNDGEPARAGFLRLRVRTDRLGSGTLTLLVDGTPVRAQGFPSIRANPGTVRTVAFDVPERDVERVLGHRLDDPDAAPVTLGLFLVDRSTGTPLAATCWRGYLRGPRLEVGDDEDAVVEQSVSGCAVLHDAPARSHSVTLTLRPPAEASYFLLFTGAEPDDVRLSPEDPGAYRRVRVVAGGALLDAEAKSIQVEHELRSGREYLVLWSFRGDRGWVRSAVHGIGSSER